MKRWLVVGGVVAVGLAVLGLVFREQLIARFIEPTKSEIKTSDVDSSVEVMADELTTPWSIAFLPDGNMLVTERSGRLVKIGEDKTRIPINGVRETSEGGLLGAALSPEYQSDGLVYLYYTTSENNRLTNRIDRYHLDVSSARVTDSKTILSGIPAAPNHNGGAIAFGPDGKLYVTTGDAGSGDLAQDISSLAGKILRLNADGSVPDDNPFANAVWSYGHRNPQGIAWDEEDRLWAVEHGPSYFESGRDELNLIKRGGNYGWPIITGDERKNGMMSPVIQSGEDETWAPSGMAYHDGRLYFAGLRGQSLYRAEIDGDSIIKLDRMLAGEYGRLRAVTVHDSWLYVSTSNRDGRGRPKSDDDKILRINVREVK